MRCIRKRSVALTPPAQGHQLQVRTLGGHPTREPVFPNLQGSAVQIEARWIAWHRNGETVEILDRPLIEQAISSDTWFDAEWTNRNHHSWFAGMFDPCAVRIGNAHRANRPIAVNVSNVEAWPPESVPPWPRTNARAVELG